MIPLPVATLVNEFNVGPLTVLRASSPTINAYGEAVAATPVEMTVDPIAVYTPSGRELESVPEADRHRETVAIATRVALRTAGDGRVPDRLLYRGRSWRVSNVQDYELQGEVWLSMAVLEDEVPS